MFVLLLTVSMMVIFLTVMNYWNWLSELFFSHFVLHMRTDCYIAASDQNL